MEPIRGGLINMVLSKFFGKPEIYFLPKRGEGKVDRKEIEEWHKKQEDNLPLIAGRSIKDIKNRK